MSQIDFAIAILLIITVLTYSLVSVSSKLTNDFNTFTAKKLEESTSSLSKQLFKIQDNKSLISNFKKIQASFNEAGGYQHIETVNISITPAVNKIHIYDNFLNEISSTIIDDGIRVNISFELNFNPNENSYVNIFYDDAPTSSITYTSNITETNITSVILSEEDVYVLSQERCSNLKVLSYEEAKSKFGFPDNFYISECEYGGESPFTANIILKSVPLLIEKTGGTLNSTFVKLKVW
jgi:hypothetical protein